jgi:hypothetical protein
VDTWGILLCMKGSLIDEMFIYFNVTMLGVISMV